MVEDIIRKEINKMPISETDETETSNIKKKKKGKKGKNKQVQRENKENNNDKKEENNDKKEKKKKKKKDKRKEQQEEDDEKAKSDQEKENKEENGGTKAAESTSQDEKIKDLLEKETEYKKQLLTLTNTNAELLKSLEQTKTEFMQYKKDQSLHYEEVMKFTQQLTNVLSKGSKKFHES